MANMRTRNEPSASATGLQPSRTLPGRRYAWLGMAGTAASPPRSGAVRSRLRSDCRTIAPATEECAAISFDRHWAVPLKSLQRRPPVARPRGPRRWRGQNLRWQRVARGWEPRLSYLVNIDTIVIYYLYRQVLRSFMGRRPRVPIRVLGSIGCFRGALGSVWETWEIAYRMGIVTIT